MDPSATLTIGVSPWRMLLLAAGALVMAGLSATIVFRLIPTERVGDTQEVAALVGLPFFGLCGAVAIWRLAALRGPVVTLGPEGFQDVRVARDVIPWSAVQAVTTWQAHKQRVMVLAVRPEVERGLALTPIARWTRGANRRLGADGLAISAVGLKIRYDDLLAETTARLRDARS